MRAPVLAAMLMLPALASAGEYRRLVVFPGLPIEGEILSTEADGFVLEVAQGAWFVPFDSIEDMVNLDSPPSAPVPWTLVLGGEGLSVELAREAFRSIPVVEVREPRAWDGDHPGSQAAACGTDLGCLTGAVSSALDAPAWVYAAVAEPMGEGFRLRARLVSTGMGMDAQVALDSAPVAWTDAARAVLGLEPTGEAPEAFEAALEEARVQLRSEAARASRHSWTPSRVTAWSFVPVPGLPSLLQKDYAGFGGALASTAALAAAWTWTSGRASTRTGEQIALATLGSYVSSVASSQLFGHLSLGRGSTGTTTVAIMPRFDDRHVSGVSLSLTWAPGSPRLVGPYNLPTSR